MLRLRSALDRLVDRELSGVETYSHKIDQLLPGLSIDQSKLKSANFSSRCDLGQGNSSSQHGYTARHRYAAYIVMALVNRYRPHRAVVRCKAKMHLLETADVRSDWDQPFDDVLLKELAVTLFQSSQYQVLVEQCHSKQDADDVEERLAQALASTYWQILKRHQNPVVQSLNALL